MELDTQHHKGVAIISSLTGGLGHYCAHLAHPLSKLCPIKFITYPQVDLSGSVVKHITDTFVAQNIKWPRFDIDEGNPQSIISVYDYLKKKDIHIINLHIGTTVKRKINYFTTLMNYFRYANNTKFVFTLHDVLPFDEDRNLTKMLKMFYAISDYNIVGNPKEKSKLINYFGIPESKTTVIPHGIYDLFDHDLYTSRLARNFLGIPVQAKVLLFFGWMREYKGFHYLTHALKHTVKTHPDTIVYVASGTKYASPGLVERNLRLIHRLELDDHFMLNLNYLNTSDVEAVFKASDIVVLPYTHASQSGVLMMSCGFKKPVVVTEAFYDKKWIQGRVGEVAKTKDSKSLAERITYLLDRPDLGQQYGQTGYTYASEHFSWQTIAKKYYDVFTRLVA